MNFNVKNTIKTLLIILSILSANITLALENNTSPHSKILLNIIDPPNTAALNVMINALSSLKELKKQKQATTENIRALIKIKLLPSVAINISTRLALKKHWDNLNNKQKYLFQEYISQSLIRDYAGALGVYEQLDSVSISVDPKVKRKDNKAIVKLLVSLHRDQKPFELTLKMIRLNQWQVYDILFSGVSFIKNYQAQFNSHIRRKGLNNLIQEITNKLAKG